MNLLEAIEGKEYIVKDIVTEDEELEAFLFFLWDVTAVSRLRLYPV